MISISLSNLFSFLRLSPFLDRQFETPSYYPHINLLRAFASFSVLIYHVIEHFPWTTFPTSSILVWFRIGWIGVDLFFVISGFVIMLSALRIYDMAGQMKPRTIFIRRRLARIVPLYFLTGLVSLVFVQPVKWDAR